MCTITTNAGRKTSGMHVLLAMSEAGKAGLVKKAEKHGIDGMNEQDREHHNSIRRKYGLDAPPPRRSTPPNQHGWVRPE